MLTETAIRNAFIAVKMTNKYRHFLQLFEGTSYHGTDIQRIIEQESGFKVLARGISRVAFLGIGERPNWVYKTSLIPNDHYQTTNEFDRINQLRNFIDNGKLTALNGWGIPDYDLIEIKYGGCTEFVGRMEFIPDDYVAPEHRSMTPNAATIWDVEHTWALNDLHWGNIRIKDGIAYPIDLGF